MRDLRYGPASAAERPRGECRYEEVRACGRARRARYCARRAGVGSRRASRPSGRTSSSSTRRCRRRRSRRRSTRSRRSRCRTSSARSATPSSSSRACTARAASPLVFQLGYYTQVAGLGATPNGVVINGAVDVFNQCDGIGHVRRPEQLLALAVEPDAERHLPGRRRPTRRTTGRTPAARTRTTSSPSRRPRRCAA